MKKSIVAGVLGVVAVTAAYGQGHVLFSNYLSNEQNQIIWTDDVRFAPLGKADQALTSDFGLQFQLYFGEGVITDPSALTAGQIFGLFAPADEFTPPGSTHGPGGLFFDVVQILPTWASGDTFTFMYKVVDGQLVDGIPVVGESALWQQTATLVSSEGAPLPMDSIPGLVVMLVPEPSSFALLGLGSAVFLMFRRRNS